jgi:hypothetical protein
MTCFNKDGLCEEDNCYCKEMTLEEAMIEHNNQLRKLRDTVYKVCASTEKVLEYKSLLLNKILYESNNN